MKWILLLMRIIGAWGATQQYYVKINHHVLAKTKAISGAITRLRCATFCDKDTGCFGFNWYNNQDPSCELITYITTFWVNPVNGKDTYLASINHNKRILYIPERKSKKDGDDFCMRVKGSLPKYPAAPREKKWFSSFGYYYLRYELNGTNYTDSEGNVFLPDGKWTTKQPNGNGTQKCILSMYTGLNDFSCIYDVDKLATLCVLEM